MELRQLKYFVTVARTLNFSEASRRLFITQGTLSQQIRQLEDELDIHLFDRTSHSVALTEAGEELLPLAESTIEASKECSNRMNDLRGAITGTLNIGVTQSFSELLIETVKVFVKRCPGVKLNIHYKTAAELMDMLREKSVDLALAFKPIKEYEEVDSEVLFTTDLSVVMRKDHPLAERKSLSIHDLGQYRIVLPGSGLQARRIFDNYVGVDTRMLNVEVEVNDPTIIMDIVQGTNLVTMVSSLAAYYRPNLVAIPLKERSGQMLGCVHRLRNGYRKRASEEFLKILRDSALIDRMGRE